MTARKRASVWAVELWSRGAWHDCAAFCGAGGHANAVARRRYLALTYRHSYRVAEFVRKRGKR